MSGRGRSQSSRRRPKDHRGFRELDQLPKRIEELETEIGDIHERMADPAFYQLPGDEIAAQKERLAGVEADLQTAYQRWEELEQSKSA